MSKVRCQNVGRRRDDHSCFDRTHTLRNFKICWTSCNPWRGNNAWHSAKVFQNLTVTGLENTRRGEMLRSPAPWSFQLSHVVARRRVLTGSKNYLLDFLTKQNIFSIQICHLHMFCDSLRDCNFPFPLSGVLWQIAPPVVGFIVRRSYRALY